MAMKSLLGLEQRLGFGQEQTQEQRLETLAHQVAPYTSLREEDLKHLFEGAYRVLLADPNEKIRAAYAQELRGRGWIVEEAADSAEALRKFRHTPIWHGVFIAQPERGEDIPQEVPFHAFDVVEQLGAFGEQTPIYICTRSPAEYTRISSHLHTRRMNTVQALYTSPENLPTSRSLDLEAGRVRERLRRRGDDAQNPLLTAMEAKYWEINLTGVPVVHFKFGGSVGDLIVTQPGESEPRDPRAIKDFADYTLRFREAHPGIAIYASVGGGPIFQIIKDANDIVTMSNESFDMLARDSLRSQARVVAEAYGKGNAEFIDPDEPDGKGPISLARYQANGVGIIPYEFNFQRIKAAAVMAATGDERVDLRSFRASDLHTLSTSFSLGAYRTVFVKDTDGIWLWDPNIKKPKRKGENVRLDEISCDDMLRGSVEIDGRRRRISRIGTDGRPQHLIEDPALIYMRTFGPQRLYVVHPRKTERPFERIYVENNTAGLSAITRSYMHE